MIHYSVIMPQRNAATEVERRLGELGAVLAVLAKPYEIICVDDGSNAENRQRLKALLDDHPCLRLLLIDRAAGLSKALSQGIAAARGEIAVVLEAGGQFPAAEIEKLVGRMARADAVFACRRLSAPRRAWRRLAQFPRRLLHAQPVRDADCLFWAARREAVAGLTLARGMHRHLPGLIARRGFRVGEIHVDHQESAPRTISREPWPSPRDLLAAWRLWRPSPCAAREVVARSGDAKQTRIDPPQPFHRSGGGPSDAQQGDRRNTTA
jgi:dolichol-phosphate mannosyltransferase